MPLLILVGGPGDSSGAFNLATPDGGYWECSLDNASDVHVRYADTAGGAFSTVAVTTSADCATPRLAVLPWRRAILTYTRPRDMNTGEVQAAADPNYVTVAGIPADFPAGIDGVPAIYERYSDDEGATWSSETLITTYGLSPIPLVSPDGTLLRTFVRSQNFPYGPYGAQPSQYSPYGTRQYPGEASPSAIFHYGPLTGGPPTQPPFARSTAPQVYGITWALGRHWIHWPLTSGGQTALFHSTDDGATWAQGRFPRAVMDGANVKLGIASASDGTLLLWTIQDQTLSSSQIVIGSVAPGQIISDPGIGNATFGVAGADLLKDNTGSTFLPAFEQDVSFASAYEGPRRWMMVTELAGEYAIGLWGSADDAASVERLS